MKTREKPRITYKLHCCLVCGLGCSTTAEAQKHCRRVLKEELLHSSNHCLPPLYNLKEGRRRRRSLLSSSSQTSRKGRGGRTKLSKRDSVSSMESSTDDNGNSNGEEGKDNEDENTDMEDGIMYLNHDGTDDDDDDDREHPEQKAPKNSVSDEHEVPYDLSANTHCPFSNSVIPGTLKDSSCKEGWTAEEVPSGALDLTIATTTNSTVIPKAISMAPATVFFPAEPYSFSSLTTLQTAIYNPAQHITVYAINPTPQNESQTPLTQGQTSSPQSLPLSLAISNQAPAANQQQPPSKPLTRTLAYSERFQKCRECEFRFRADLLQAHFEEEHGDLSVNCSVAACPVRWSTMEHMLAHKANIHIACTGCATVFLNRTELQQHKSMGCFQRRYL